VPEPPAAVSGAPTLDPQIRRLLWVVVLPELFCKMSQFVPA
jgi:hypothetical protein